MQDDPDQELNEEELRDAIQADRFELHYQPQYASRENRMVGVEGLVRLRRPDGSLVAPLRFIPVLERTGLIGEVGLNLFARGCMDAALWPSLTVAINVSPVQFRDPGLAAALIEAARVAGTDPRRMEIEITEGMFFDDPDRAKSALTALSEAGFSIALDDFGTGYSSLSYLLNLPVSKLKIDQSFIKDVPGSMRSATIIHALVALGRALGIKMVAEGVETEEQRLFLKTAGCHLLQGFLFAKAMPRDDITALYGRGSGARPV